MSIINDRCGDRLWPANVTDVSGNGLGDSADPELCRLTQEQRTREKRQHESGVSTSCFLDILPEVGLWA